MSSGKKNQIAKTSLSIENLDNMDNATLIAVVQRLLEQNRQLSELLRAYVQDKYGQRSERFVNADQLNLFASQNVEPQPGEQEPPASINTESTSSQSKTRKNRAYGRNPHPSNLEHVRVPAPTPCAEDLVCQCCNRTKVKMREIIRNSRYEFKPATLFIEDMVEDIYACPECEDQQPISIKATELIPNGAAGPGLMSEIIGNRYCLHLPLHRQEQIFARAGGNISRSTMCGWLTAVSITLRPLYDLMKELLLQSKVICTDDTPVKVQDRKKKKNIKTGRIWIYIGDKSYPFNLFDYTEGRGRAGPMQFLAGFKGYLQGDCFSGNEALCTASGALHCACNAHARRYFVKSLPNNKSASECALTFFQKLYKIESDARDFDLNTVDLQRMRQEESVPVLNEFKQWLDKESLSMLPQSSFGKAIFYCLNNWEALIRYTEDGDIAIDNNCSEREMKTVAVGRKNWYFLGSDAGGETAEVLMSLISTCKRHGVEPYAYLKDVITRLTNEPGYKRTDLLPNNWQPQQSISVNPEMAIA
jgi:transposase